MNEKKAGMKLLVVIHEFPPVGGGGGRVAEDICRKLVQRGYEVTVVTMHVAGLPRQEVVDGIRVIRLPSMRRTAYQAGFWAMYMYVLNGLLACLRLIRSWRPDLIHVHFAVPAGALGLILSQLTGIPYVMTVHLGDVPGGVPDKTNEWFRWIFPFTHRIWRKSSRIVAVSEFTRGLALQSYSAEIQVIPNGVDLDVLSPGRIEVQTPPRIVFAGRFMAQKNPQRIVEILTKLQDLPWECAMLGDGPLFESTRQAIRANGLEDRFYLPGWVTPEDVIEQLSRSDILFMPSLSEGLPVVGVHALAMGLAIVASRAGGFVELVEQGENGFLFDPGDCESMQDALRALLTDRDKLLHARNRSRKLTHRFDLSIVADGYDAIFQEVRAA